MSGELDEAIAKIKRSLSNEAREELAQKLKKPRRKVPQMGYVKPKDQGDRRIYPGPDD